jgi:hypothetical protein
MENGNNADDLSHVTIEYTVGKSEPRTRYLLLEMPRWVCDRLIAAYDALEDDKEAQDKLMLHFLKGASRRTGDTSLEARHYYTIGDSVDGMPSDGDRRPTTPKGGYQHRIIKDMTLIPASLRERMSDDQNSRKGSAYNVLGDFWRDDFNKVKKDGTLDALFTPNVPYFPEDHGNAAGGGMKRKSDIYYSDVSIRSPQAPQPAVEASPSKRPRPSDPDVDGLPERRFFFRAWNGQRELCFSVQARGRPPAGDCKEFVLGAVSPTGSVRVALRTPGGGDEAAVSYSIAQLSNDVYVRVEEIESLPPGVNESKCGNALTRVVQRRFCVTLPDDDEPVPPLTPSDVDLDQVYHDLQVGTCLGHAEYALWSTTTVQFPTMMSHTDRLVRSEEHSPDEGGVAANRAAVASTLRATSSSFAGYLLFRTTDGQYLGLCEEYDADDKGENRTCRVRLSCKLTGEPGDQWRAVHRVVMATDLFLPPPTLDYLLDSMEDRSVGFVMFAGTSGMSKTFTSRALALELAGKRENILNVQFHPSYSYADFVYGPSVNHEGRLVPELGSLLRFLGWKRGAAGKPKEPEPWKGAGRRVVLIDEFNRGNAPSIFGELLSLLEYRDESMQLSSFPAKFSLPGDVLFIATVNDDDRNAVSIDRAFQARLLTFQLDSYIDWDGDRQGEDHSQPTLFAPDKVLRLYLQKQGWSENGEAELLKSVNTRLLQYTDHRLFVAAGRLLHQTQVRRLRHWMHVIVPMIKTELKRYIRQPGELRERVQELEAAVVETYRM